VRVRAGVQMTVVIMTVALRGWESKGLRGGLCFLEGHPGLGAPAICEVPHGLRTGIRRFLDGRSRGLGGPSQLVPSGSAICSARMSPYARSAQNDSSWSRACTVCPREQGRRAAAVCVVWRVGMGERHSGLQRTASTVRPREYRWAGAQLWSLQWQRMGRCRWWRTRQPIAERHVGPDRPMRV
jgi:hypothetical protein